MESKQLNNQNLIIGGTIKAATSSVFTYLSAHPEICGSTVKETFFFSRDYTGNFDKDLEKYNKYFKLNDHTKINLEASPNYLSYKKNIAPDIKALLPESKILFILRNPVDRAYSHYHFAMGKLELPENLSFEEFIDICEQGANSDDEQPDILERHSRALEIGKYGQYLQHYFDEFPSENIKVTFFDDLKKNPLEFMENVCRFIDIDPGFYKEYQFNKANVTFSSKLKLLHRIVLLLNRVLEPILRQRPAIKMYLVETYKRFNQNKQGYQVMDAATRKRLDNYYSSSNQTLATMLADQSLPEWLR